MLARPPCHPPPGQGGGGLRRGAASLPVIPLPPLLPAGRLPPTPWCHRHPRLDCGQVQIPRKASAPHAHGRSELRPQEDGLSAWSATFPYGPSPPDRGWSLATWSATFPHGPSPPDRGWSLATWSATFPHGPSPPDRGWSLASWDATFPFNLHGQT
eukprot:scaffold9354_cov108-Isochrysis_galbana.AAC.11